MEAIECNYMPQRHVSVWTLTLYTCVTPNTPLI